MPEVTDRVYNLENLMAQTQMELQKTLMIVQTLSVEMKFFRDEMKDFKDEMKRDRKDFKDEMSGFKDEMKEFKNELRLDRKEFKDEMKQDRKELYKQWGKLSDKLGSIVEDMVAPNIKSIGEKYFNLIDCIDFGIRRIRKHSKDRGKEKEFDIIAVYDNVIILNETKSTPRMDYINDFIDFIKNREFYEYFPEYFDKKIIPVFASFSIPEHMVKHISGHNILAMVMGDENMDIINPDVVKYLKENFL